ncbi:hypothetical protein [uncultured Pseudomonas sp.]|uniref:hypothetical protein n=1 Tax=uncultured Pseudomonas sp. TaxID=114707 RepID=UPI00259ACF70|nr:hypothetical protein [uncultured Pseudomonas sp.]
MSEVNKVSAVDAFKGDNQHLISCIEALLSLDAKGALVPHGVGGHARAMLSSAAQRLADFDRVTAERDALQARLTAADEREDALCSLAPEAELALKALNVAVSVYDVELADSARRGLRLIIAALKPAEGGGDA